MSLLRRNGGGYTILEVIIVLTVSSVLFASSVVVYNRQNRRTQFTESVNTFAQNIQDVLNDVETGFYPSTNSFSCSVSGTGRPTINYSGNAQQGSNTDCIFLGKAIQFGPSGTSNAAIDIFTIVGRRLAATASADPVSDISQAQPVGLNQLVERKLLTGGVRITAVKRVGIAGNYAGIAMVANSGVTGGFSSGHDARASLAFVNGGLNNSKNAFLGTSGSGGIQNMTTANITAAQSGVDICLQEPGTGGRRAYIELAPGRSQIIVETHIDKACP